MGALSLSEFHELMSGMNFQRIGDARFYANLAADRSWPCREEIIILIKGAAQGQGVWRCFGRYDADSIVQMLLSWHLNEYISKWAVVLPTGTVIQPREQ